MPTKSLYGTLFYEPAERSEDSVRISHAAESRCVWKQYDVWTMDTYTDYFEGPAEIAKALLQFEVFQQYPENVRELLAVLRNGLWTFGANSVPTFGGATPADVREVVSWDETNVLCGTTIANLQVVTRGEWQSLCDRESGWFE